MTKNSNNTADDGSEIQSKVNEEFCKFKAEFRDHLNRFAEIQAKQRANLTMLKSKFEDLLREIKESYGPSEPISMVADKLLASNDSYAGSTTTLDSPVDEGLKICEMEDSAGNGGGKSVIKHSYVEEKPNQSLVEVIKGITVDASICDAGSEPEVQQVEAVMSTTSFASTVKEQVNDDPVFKKIVVQNGASKLFTEMSESILEEDLSSIEGTKVAHYMFDEMPGLLSVKLDSEIDGYQDLRLLVIDFLIFVGYEDEASRIIFDPGGSFLYHINCHFCNSNGDKHDFDSWIDKLNAELTDTWASGCIHFVDVVNATSIFITFLVLPIIVGLT